MNKNRKGILINDSGELAIRVVRDSNGLITSGMVVGACIDQEAYFVLKAKPGDYKEDPIIGPGLTQFVRGKYNQSAVELLIKQHFERVGIDWDDYKDRLQLIINN